MFTLTKDNGLHFKFPNGFTVAIQFGTGHSCHNFCENPIMHNENNLSSQTAEVIIIDNLGEWVTNEYVKSTGDSLSGKILGYVEVSTIPEVLAWAKEQYPKRNVPENYLDLSKEKRI